MEGSISSAMPSPSRSIGRPVPIIPSRSGSEPPPSMTSGIPSLSESRSWKSSMPSRSVSKRGTGVPPWSGSTISMTPSRSRSKGIPVPIIPSPSGSEPPASITSRIPSLSASRSRESGMRSPSVSRLPSPSSTTSKIPSLSSS